MRHGKKNNHLGRTASHRSALLSNMATSLIMHKRIVTTVAKAKELRKFVEPLLTKSKEDNTHNRRIVFSYLQNKEAIKTLFGEVSEKIANRNGGYTRIIKLGQRQGDAAETAMIELVDYNEILLSLKSEAPAKAKKTRRAGKKAGSDTTAAVETAETVTMPVATIEEPTAEAPELEVAAVAEVVEIAAPEVEEAPVAEEATEEIVAAAETASESNESAETDNPAEESDDTPKEA